MPVTLPMPAAIRNKVEWLDTLATSSGVGLWDAVFHEGDALHPKARWTWSAEFRRLCGFGSEAEFPNVVGSWADRLHPEDADATFATFLAAAAAGSTYDTSYRLKLKDGSYRWFRATGGVVLDGRGRARRACGSLVDIHDAKTAQIEQERVVEQLRAAMGRIAQGELKARLGSEFPQGFGAIKEDFNGALAKLCGLIGAVSESAEQIRAGSDEIAQASEDLARRTEGNAASLEETTAAIAEMETRIRATAQAAERTVERADGTITVVGSGRTIADEAVAAMGRVSESAKGIDSVIEGLDKIAFQTRVLAMNAAVEAGRAGEAGRGFAVVADLVSALAMRAEEESKRARDQLTVTQHEVDSAVGAVTKVDGAFASIVENVNEVHTLLNGMATDNQAQSMAITQITSALGSMDRSFQQNAAMVEQTSAAARNLSNEATQLADRSAAFDTGTGPAIISRAKTHARAHATLQ